jgi:hypothetical protein
MVHVEPNHGLHCQIIMHTQREQMTPVNQHNLHFLKKHDISETSSVSVFEQRKQLTWWLY